MGGGRVNDNLGGLCKAGVVYGEEDAVGDWQTESGRIAGRKRLVHKYLRRRVRSARGPGDGRRRLGAFQKPQEFFFIFGLAMSTVVLSPTRARSNRNRSRAAADSGDERVPKSAVGAQVTPGKPFREEDDESHRAPVQKPGR